MFLVSRARVDAQLSLSVMRQIDVCPSPRIPPEIVASPGSILGSIGSRMGRNGVADRRDHFSLFRLCCTRGFPLFPTYSTPSLRSLCDRQSIIDQVLFRFRL